MLLRTASLYKNSFAGLSPKTWLLSCIMLINRSGTMVLPFMTLYLTSKEVGRSLTDAGIVMGLFGLGSVVGAYFGGRSSDRIGFFKVQLFTLFFGGVLFLILGQIKSFPLICVFSFLLSLVNEAFRPANSTAIAHYSDATNRTRSYSLNRLAVNLGWAVGTSLGGLIASINYEWLFWVDGFTNIAAAILLFVFLKPGEGEIHPHQKQREETAPQVSAYKDKTYLWFIFLATIFGMCFFQLFTTIPKYWRDNLLLSERFIGFVMGLNGVLIVGLEMVLIYLLERRQKNHLYIALGVGLCGLAYFGLLIPANAKLITLVMVGFITVGEIISMPFMNSYWINRSNEKNRGQYAGLYTMSWGIGQTIGPVICSSLVDLTSFTVLFVCLGIALLVTALGFYGLKHVGQSTGT